MGGGVTFLAQAATPSGWMAWVAVPMANVMEWLYGYIPNYGWVIVLLTLALRLLLWPFQSQMNRSQRLMPALAPRIKEIKERNQGDRTRIQQETMALYKENGLNPAAGCLLILLVVVLSWGLVDCRVVFQGQSWLWIDDLSRPDRLAFFGLPIAPLAIGVALALFALSRLIPMGSSLSSPWAAAGMALMIYFTFNTSMAALSLAWATSNLVMVLQTWWEKGRMIPAPPGGDSPGSNLDPA